LVINSQWFLLTNEAMRMWNWAKRISPFLQKIPSLWISASVFLFVQLSRSLPTESRQKSQNHNTLTEEEIMKQEETTDCVSLPVISNFLPSKCTCPVLIKPKLKWKQNIYISGLFLVSMLTNTIKVFSSQR
jgi:hypothetical protein